MLGIYCVSEERDLYRGKLALTQSFGFAFSSIGQSHQVTFDDTQGVLITYSNPGPHSSSKPMKAVKSIKITCVCEIEMPPKIAKGKNVGTHGKVSSLRILIV